MSGITDAIAWFEASETMLRVTHGKEVAGEAMAIAARLRGEATTGGEVPLPTPWQCETAMCPQLFTAEQMREYARAVLATQHGANT